jgi:hypothetical protein
MKNLLLVTLAATFGLFTQALARPMDAEENAAWIAGVCVSLAWPGRDPKECCETKCWDIYHASVDYVVCNEECKLLVRLISESEDPNTTPNV